MATHPIDLRQTVSAFCEYTIKHWMVAAKEYAKEYSPNPSLQIFEAAELQVGHLGADGTRSSRLQGIISAVRANLYFTYPPYIPDLVQGVFAGPIHRSGLSILTTEGSQWPRSAIEPPNQILRMTLLTALLNKLDTVNEIDLLIYRLAQKSCIYPNIYPGRVSPIGIEESLLSSQQAADKKGIRNTHKPKQQGNAVLPLQLQEEHHDPKCIDPTTSAAQITDGSWPRTTLTTKDFGQDLIQIFVRTL